MIKFKDVTKVTSDGKDSIQLSWARHESIDIFKRAQNNTADGRPAPSSGRLERRGWLALDCAARLLLLRGALR